MQQDTIEHELIHIQNGDFDSESNVTDVESM